MIDDDFSPNRLQYRALGHLLVQANNYPLSPSLREVDLLIQVYGRYVGPDRQVWLTELGEHGLVRIMPDTFRTGDRAGIPPFNVCLTAAGIYYAISRAFLFMENARTPTDDFRTIVNTPWALQSYFSPSAEDVAPAADRFVRFDDNQKAYDVTLDAFEKVTRALASDNEIGSKWPALRDEKLAELQAIRQLLEKKRAGNLN